MALGFAWAQGKKIKAIFGTSYKIQSPSISNQEQN
jgi:hypothetical protein